MKKNLFIIAILSLVCLATSAQPKIEPELQQALSSRSSEMISINIVLNEQINTTLLKSKTFLIKDAEIKKGLIVKELKAYSKDNQSDILDFLKAEEAKNCVANIKSHWIANSICCDATKDVIEKLTQYNNIEVIGLNQEVQLLCNSNDSSIEEYTYNLNAMPHVIQINADDVWSLGYTGKNVVVAVLDSGTNFEHYDLNDHLWIGYADTDGDGEKDDIIYGWNFATKDAIGNSNIKDDYGHGTHCAGIVCGDGTSGNTTGIAPDASLMTVKIVNRTGGGTPEQMISGVEFAVENGADILSMSLGFKNNQIGEAAKTTIRKTFENVLEAGVIVCAAAGNDGNSFGAPNNIDIPASCPPPYLHPDQTLNGGLSSVVCVGAVNSNDEYASFSSQGPSSWGEIEEWNDYPFNDSNIGLIRPDIVAPGDWIYSLKYNANDKYDFKTGTSQATPCVAGVMALMLEKNPNLTPAEICEIIENSAVKLSDKKNNFTGSGRIDALNAINEVESANENPYIRVTSFSPEKSAICSNLEISVILKNYGNGSNSNATIVSLSTDNPYITITDNSKTLTSLSKGDSKEILFNIAIDENTPNGHTAYFRVTSTDGELVWNDDLAIKIESLPKIVFNSKSINTIKAGEVISLDVEMINSGTAATTSNSAVTLSSSSSYVSVIEGKRVLSPMGIGEKESVNFSIKVDKSIPNNSLVNLDLYVTPNNFCETKDYIYEFEVGKDAFGYFDDGFDGWTTIDANNDGRNHPWWHSSQYITHWVENLGSIHSGKGCIISETYCQASMIKYNTPIDNYLISPKIKVTKDSKFSFWARPSSIYYYGQHFGVAISENGNSSADDFITIKDWTILNKDDTDWIKYSIDLSEYEGKEIYVAVRHFFTSKEWQDFGNGLDLYLLHVDDAIFENVIDVSNNVKYDNYSNFSLNVKSDPIAAPSNVKVTAVNENSLNITWDAVTNAQSYNLYRDGALITNVKGSQYTDTNLKPNREYSYSLTSVLNGEESVTSESVSATTNRADHNIAIKSISPEVLKLGENELEITFVNDGKYEQDSRSTVTLSCSNPNVTILTNNINLNALYVDQESTKSFTVVVGDVPIATPIEFNAHIAQKFSPNYSWDCPFVVMANDPLGVEESKNNENIASIYVRDNNLCINGINGKGYIEIFDISGKILYNETSIEYNTNINLSDFKKGIYIIRIKNANGIKTQKFIY